MAINPLSRGTVSQARIEIASHLRRRSALLLSALLALAGAASAEIPTPALPAIPDKTVNIREQGAAGDGKTLDTQAIAKAIDAVASSGGGTVVFPAGTYLTGAVKLRSSVRLQLDKDATLLFSTNPSDYPVTLTRWECTECMNYCGLISAEPNAHDIAITGQGTLDGQGQVWWPWKDHASAAMKRLRQMGETSDDPSSRVFGKPEDGLRPCLFEPVGATRVLLEGVTVKNSPMWTIHPVFCKDLTFRSLNIHGTGPNTDGLDPDSCSNILIKNSTFDTGDDCITLKSGRDRDGRRAGKPTENVHVRNCTFLRGHGTVVIGSEMSGGVRNVLAEDCTADGTDTGVRIKSRRGRGGAVENVVYRNFKLKNIQKQAITIDMFYEAGPNPDTSNGPDGVPAFHDITVENLTCDSATTAILVRGLPESPIQRLTLKNVHISASKPMTLTDARDVTLDNLSVTPGPAPAKVKSGD